MRFWTNKGRILRIRPGHLANFSGGAGYMPFIIMYSVVGSVLFGIIGSLALAVRGRGVRADENDPKTGLHEFVRFARWHTLVCLVVALGVGAFLFNTGINAVYGDKWQFAPVTAVVTVGPLVAWFLSMVSLMKLIARRGARWTNLLIAAVIHVLLVAVLIPLAMLVSAVTGVRL